MLEITLELEVITPAFITGADPTQCELRWSSFAGQLRYWFRAMMGKIVGNDLEALKRLESAVFGTTDSAAPFRAYVTPSSQEGLIIEQAVKDTQIPPGEHYLSFSQYENIPKEKQTTEQKRQGKDKILLRSYLCPGNRITAVLQFRRPDVGLKNVLLATFWLMTHFGGIGTRTRRGFGGLSVKNKDIFRSIDQLNGELADITRFRKMLVAIEGVFQIFAERYLGKLPELITNNKPEFASFVAFEAILVTTRIAQTREPFNAKEWLNYWGMYLRAIRTCTLIPILSNRPDPSVLKKMMIERQIRTPDYLKVISDYFNEAVPNTTTFRMLPNLPFGLPYTVTSRRYNPKRSRNGMSASIVAKKKDKKFERRTSPIVFRPILLEDGSLGCLIALFAGSFLPSGATLKLNGGAADIPVEMPDITTIKSPFTNWFFERIETDFGVKRFSTLPPLIGGAIR